jgi:hypothetical protein
VEHPETDRHQHHGEEVEVLRGSPAEQRHAAAETLEPAEVRVGDLRACPARRRSARST